MATPTTPSRPGRKPSENGKVALISGGARGQGATEAALFAAEGAAVILTDVLDEAGAATAAACGGLYLHHGVTPPGLRRCYRAAGGSAEPRAGRALLRTSRQGARRPPGAGHAQRRTP